MPTLPRWIACLGASILCVVSQVHAAETSLETFSVKGVVPANTNLDIGDLSAGVFIAFPSITDSDFNNGHITNYSSPITFENIRTNSPVILKIKSNGWTTLPNGYDTTNGPKKTDGSDSQFLLQVDSTSLYVSSGSMTVEGSFGTTFVPITSTAANLLKLGSVDSGSGVNTGVHNASVNIFPRMLLDTAYDLAGDYVVELELIIADQI